MPRLPRKSGGDQGTPEGRQGVHPTPWECTKRHACHAKAAETKGHRRDARAYIRPLGSAPSAALATQKPVPRLPRKSHRQSGGDQGTPEGRQGVHPTPWQCTKCRACHAKIRPPGSAPSAAPATQKPPAERRRPRDTGGTPGRTSDPLAVHG